MSKPGKLRRFAQTYVFLLLAMIGAFRAERSVVLIAVTSAMVGISSVFYWIVEGWGLLDAAYFSLITMATVGYGDIYPITAAGKVFTMGLVVAGIGIFVALVTTIATEFMARSNRVTGLGEDKQPPAKD